jgi:hypothetical protein
LKLGTKQSWSHDFWSSGQKDMNFQSLNLNLNRMEKEKEILFPNWPTGRKWRAWPRHTINWPTHRGRARHDGVARARSSAWPSRRHRRPTDDHEFMARTHGPWRIRQAMSRGRAHTERRWQHEGGSLTAMACRNHGVRRRAWEGAWLGPTQ